MRSPAYLILYLLFLFFPFCSYSGNIDSLLHVINKTKNDSVKVDTYNELVWEYYGVNNDSALHYAHLAIKYAHAGGYVLGLGNAYRYAGQVYERKADFAKALLFQNKALKIYQEINYKKGLANTYNNIAIVYHNLDEWDKALEYQVKCLRLCEDIDEKMGVASSYGNIGNIYRKKNDYHNARINYEKSLELFRKMNNKYGEALSLGNLGQIIHEKGDHQKALKYLLESLAIRNKLGIKQSIASILNAIGEVYISLYDYNNASYYFKESQKLAEEAVAMDELKQSYYGNYRTEKARKNYMSALTYYELYTQIKDTIFNSTKNDELNKIKTQYELDKQEAELKQKAKAEKERIEAINREKSLRDLVIIYSVLGLLIIVVFFTYFIYKRFKLTIRQKMIIETQKTLVDQKNKQITDSINYAQRIQSALLPGEADLKKIFPQSFILYIPKDIVSGDFYWVHENSTNIIIAVADCTGHGVPGGFMSMLGIGFLNEIIIEREILSPAQILNELRNKIIWALKQQAGADYSKDGMDMVLCNISKKTNTLLYAAANNRFHIIKNGKAKEYKGDKMPIGYYSGEEKDFVQHSVSLDPGDMIYLYTDGYADQFGGNKKATGKKFKYSQLQELFLKNYMTDAAIQKEKFYACFENWKRGIEQTDDVTIIGFKYNAL